MKLVQLLFPFTGEKLRLDDLSNVIHLGGSIGDTWKPASCLQEPCFY
jgi:hypothetical protein